MPNHVSNIVTFNGSKEEIEAVFDILENDEGGITFDKFAPMPEELKGTKSPVTIISEEEFLFQQERIEKGDLTKDEVRFGISRGISKTHQIYLIEKYGADNWYDWSTQNWGTKWGAYDGNFIDDKSIYFQTAWATPFGGMISLSKAFPEVQITVDYADEDFGYNVGQYVLLGGVEVSQNVPKGGSEEAVRMALQIQGGEDYYLGEFISNITEEEIDEIKKGNDEYTGTFLKIILEDEIVDEDYPTHVLAYLLFTAVEQEKYEYANELKKIVDLKKV